MSAKPKTLPARKKISTRTIGVKSLGPFDFINSINEGTKGTNLLQEVKADTSEFGANPGSPDKAYVPFIINRGLSYDSDTILLANEMNLHAGLPPKMQYDFLRHVVRPRKRWSKWLKRVEDGPDLALIKKVYNYSTEKARDALTLFTPEALDELQARYSIGGFVK